MRHRARFTALALALFSALASALVAGAGTAAEPRPAPPEAGPPPGETVVVLLRHAEKSSKHPLSELSSAGRRRAAALVPVLAPFRPKNLFASDRRRTQQTLEPTARALGLALRVLPLGDEEALAAEILGERRGETAVVCGHSDSLARIAAYLGSEEEFPPVDGFDRLWIVRIPADDGRVTVEERLQPPVPRGR